MASCTSSARCSTRRQTPSRQSSKGTILAAQREYRLLAATLAARAATSSAADGLYNVMLLLHANRQLVVLSGPPYAGAAAHGVLGPPLPCADARHLGPRTACSQLLHRVLDGVANAHIEQQCRGSSPVGRGPHVLPCSLVSRGNLLSLLLRRTPSQSRDGRAASDAERLLVSQAPPEQQEDAQRVPAQQQQL